VILNEIGSELTLLLFIIAVISKLFTVYIAKTSGFTDKYKAFFS
jgi:hypothetical protein